MIALAHCSLSTKSLIMSLADKPYACGKRDKGDQQEPLGDGITRSDGGGMSTYTENMKCLVCQKVHLVARSVYVSPNVRYFR